MVRLHLSFFGCLAKKSAIVYILLIMCAIVAPYHSVAQAVPDTSLNNIIDDTLHQKKAGPGVQIITPRTKSGQDSSDMIVVKKGPFQPNPKKAGLYSALLPGLGQLYNHNYWKVPVVYAAVGVAGYYFFKNQNDYQSYRKAYIGRVNNPYPTDKYVGILSFEQLRQNQNDAKKYLDLTVLFSSIGYALQIMDAVTSAHLKNFDISRDISMQMRPVISQNNLGLGLVMNFK